LASLTMFLLAALLCNYGRGKCLIDIGTEGNALLRFLTSGPIAGSFPKANAPLRIWSL
jgi:hypothetical protein